MENKERLETVCALLTDEGVGKIADTAREMVLSPEKGLLVWMTESQQKALGVEVNKVFQKGFWKGYWFGASVATIGAITGIYIYENVQVKKKLKKYYEILKKSVEC